MTTEEQLLANEEEAAHTDKVLSMTMDIGHLLLQNGAEISRVEDTMHRIARYYGVNSDHYFVLSNGIFITGDEGKGNSFAKVEHIPVRGAQLDRVVAVNQLSREILKGKYTLDEAIEQVRKIRAMKDKPFWAQVLASGLGAACFCIMFDGHWQDALVSFGAGVLVYIFILTLGRKMSKMVANLLGSILATLVCVAAKHFGLGTGMSYMIIGSVIPLIPGIAFINGIRDICNGDYLAGTVRLLDALLVFLMIAIGVGVVISGYQLLTGGVAL